MQNEARAVVWDLDGVIVDSGEAHNVSWIVMAKEYGLPYDPDADFKRTFGRHNNDIIGLLWPTDDTAVRDQMALRKEQIFRDAAEQLKPLPGVPELMEALQQAGWKQAIGSSAPIENVDLLLRSTGLGRYMDAISSGADVTVGKPNPDVFLIAFRRLGIAPENGVVVEDAPAGVQAALAAGSVCLAVTNTQTKETLQNAGANRVVDSLAGITVADLETLIQRNERRAKAV